MFEYITFNGENLDDVTNWINSRKCERTKDFIIETVSKLDYCYLVDVFSNIELYNNGFDFHKKFNIVSTSKELNGVCAFLATNRYNNYKKETVIIYREDSAFYVLDCNYDPVERMYIMKLYDRSKKILILRHQLLFSPQEIDKFGVEKLIDYHRIKHGDVFVITGDDKVRRINIETIMTEYQIHNTNIQTMMMDSMSSYYMRYSRVMGDIMDILIVHDFNINEVRDKFEELLKKPVECEILQDLYFKFKWYDEIEEIYKTLIVSNNEVIGGFFNLEEPIVDKIDYNMLFK